MNAAAPVVVDTDPGADDALALLWLAALARRRHLDLAGVIATAGNVGAPQACANARGLLSLAGLREARFASGSSERGQRRRPVHGRDGLHGLSPLLPTPPAGAPAAAAPQMLHGLLHDAAGAVQVLALAPLTNLAAAERQFPGTLARAARVVMIGGSLHGGGTEFNFAFDPDAAGTVLGSGAALLVVPLEVSTRLRLGRSQVSTLRDAARSTGCEAFVDGLLAAMARRAAPARSFPVHDALAVAAVAAPSALRTEPARLAIDDAGGLTRLTGAANTLLATGCDGDALADRLAADVAALLRARPPAGGASG